MPKVARTDKTLPSWQVGLPFSKSMMKRKPVPAVRARSCCLIPRSLRVSRTIFPICSAEYFMTTSYIPVREYYIKSIVKSVPIFPFGNEYRSRAAYLLKNSRSGTLVKEGQLFLSGQIIVKRVIHCSRHMFDQVSKLQRQEGGQPFFVISLTSSLNQAILRCTGKRTPRRTY